MATASNVTVLHGQHGNVVVCGTITMSTYITGGETFDLSSHLGDLDVCMVQLAGYQAKHDGGTVSAGTVIAYGGSDDNGSALVEVSNAANLEAVTGFFWAVGKTI